MDGRQRAVKRSLQQELNRWIMIVSGIFALLAGLVSGIGAFFEARESQDMYLHQVGELLVSGLLSSGTTTAADDDQDERLVIQRLQAGQPGVLPIAADHADGLYTLYLQDERWRTLILTIGSTPHVRFAIAQQTEIRDELGWDSSLRSFFAVLLLAPLLMGVVHLIIRYSFSPIRTLAIQVDQRTETDLTPLSDQNIPQEIAPFIASINMLLQRINQVLIQQRRFVSDAAHELRTPLTALSLLTENLAYARNMEQTHLRLIPLQKGLARMRTLVNQLLSLARMQGRNSSEPQPTALQQIVQEAIADLYPLAEAKAIDLGMIQQENLTVLDSEGGLALLVRNAIDNAIRYTPAGGKIDVSLFAQDGRAVLWVVDNGPGIPAHELPQMFQPFHRASENQEPGNGLGLTISQEIAKRLGGEMTLQNCPQGGLIFCYCQPLY